MIGLILCAGMGTRLKEETKDRPKCMIEIGNKPVLEHVANYLEKQGVERIVVNLHSLPEVVMKYFGQRFLYLYEPVPMGEFNTVNLVRGWFPGEELMVMNGDTLITKKEEGKKHNGITYYHFDGRSEKQYGDFIDIGTPEGLAESRKKYDRN